MTISRAPTSWNVPADITRVGTNVITATAGSSSASATLIVGRADIAPTGLTNCLGSTNVFSLTADSSADVLWELEPADAGPVFEGGTNSGTPVSILSGPHGASVTLKAYMNGLDSCFDTANLTIVEAESLTPSGGDPLPPDDADSPTRATLWAPPPEVGPPYLVTFLADYSPPGLPAAQLPGCWQWTTTGPGIVEPDPYDPLRRYVNVSVPGTNDLAVEAGSSSNFCRFIVVKVDIQQTNVYTSITGTNMTTNTFSLTEDSFTNVTWSIDPDLSTNGGAFFAGTNVGATVEIASGTNGGIYSITATSDIYPDATDTATCMAIKLVNRTIATEPDNRFRTTIGVGELVRLFFEPPVIEDAVWSVSGGGNLSATNGSVVDFEAPDVRSTNTITAATAELNWSIILNVIEPSLTVFENLEAAASGCPNPPSINYIYLTYHANVYLQPDTVNFSMVRSYESEAAPTKTGYFVDNPATRNHDPNGPHQFADLVVTGKGTKMATYDVIGYAAGPPPFTNGTLSYDIDWLYDTGAGGELHGFDTVCMESELAIFGADTTYSWTKRSSGYFISTSNCIAQPLP